MLTVGIFIVITAGSLAVLRAVSNLTAPNRGRLRRRLAGEAGVAPAAAATPLYKNVDRWDADFAGGGAAGASRPSAGGRRAWAEDVLREAGVAMSVRHFIGLVLGLAVVFGTAGAVFAGWLAAAAGAAGGAALPVVAVGAKRKARRDRYVHQMAGSFELIARVLRAGQSVPEAFRAATEAFDDPLAGEFTRCLHQIEHGLRPEAAYRELSQRAGILELRIFVVAMTIQRQTGSNLSEVLERLAAVVRARVRLRQKIRALTAEGRLQSLTLVVLPLVTFAAMYVLNRQYAETLLAQWRLLVATAACMGVGVLWIRSIMRFEG